MGKIFNSTFSFYAMLLKPPLIFSSWCLDGYSHGTRSTEFSELLVSGIESTPIRVLDLLYPVLIHRVTQLVQLKRHIPCVREEENKQK